MQIAIRSESLQYREVRLAICLLLSFHPSLSTAVALSALHNITYVEPDCLLLLGERQTHPLPPPSPHAGSRRKTLRSPAWDFPLLFSRHGKLWPGLVYMCVCASSFLSMFSPLLSIFPFISFWMEGIGFGWQERMHTRTPCAAAIPNTCCVKTNSGDVTPWVTATGCKYTKIKAQAWNWWIWSCVTQIKRQPLSQWVQSTSYFMSYSSKLKIPPLLNCTICEAQKWLQLQIYKIALYRI